MVIVGGDLSPRGIEFKTKVLVIPVRLPPAGGVQCSYLGSTVWHPSPLTAGHRSRNAHTTQHGLKAVMGSWPPAALS